MLFSFGGVIYYGYNTIGKELYNNYKQKQQDKEIELLLKSNSNSEPNIAKTTETKTLTDTSQTTFSDFNESDYAARYTIGPIHSTKAKFIGYEEGDLVHYVFEDEVGNSFSFSVIPKTYQLVVDNSTGEYGLAPNKKYLNKTFALTWKHFEPMYNEDMEYPFEAIISIKLIEE